MGLFIYKVKKGTQAEHRPGVGCYRAGGVHFYFPMLLVTVHYGRCLLYTNNESCKEKRARAKDRRALNTVIACASCFCRLRYPVRVYIVTHPAGLLNDCWTNFYNNAVLVEDVVYPVRKLTSLCVMGK